MKYETAAVDEVQTLKGVLFPAAVRFRQIVVTGPPGSGKSTLVERLGGWPEEGYLDLSGPAWWRDRVLALRPREVHFGLPFSGIAAGLAVFDPAFLEAPLELDTRRIHIPPVGRYWFNVDWRRRYVFDVHLPSVDEMFAARQARGRVGRHRRDRSVTEAQVARQLDTYWSAAAHLHRCGLSIYVRTSLGGPPRVFV